MWKRRLRILAVFCCLILVITGSASLAEQTDVQDTGRRKLELYAYIELSTNGLDDAWIHKISDALSAALFLYNDSFDVTLSVYCSPQSANQDVISVGSFDSKERQLQRLSEELSGEKLRGITRENRDLNTSAMKKMLGIIENSASEDKALILFSNLKTEYWMADQRIYSAWQEMNLPMGIVTADALNRPDNELFQNQIYYLDGANSRSAASIAVDQVRYLGEERFAVRGIVPATDGTADGVRLNRRIIAMTENASNVYYQSGTIAFWVPKDGDSIDLSSASEAWMQYDTLVTGKLNVTGIGGTTFSKAGQIPIRVELFSNGSQRISPTDEWIVSAEARDGKGKLLQKITLGALEGDAWEGSFEPISSSGSYQITATAYHQQLQMEVEAEPALQVAIRNDAPVRTDKAIEPIQLWDWISRYATREINLSDYFTDDSPETELTYRLDKEVPGYSIEDRNILRIEAGGLETAASAVEIIAKDKEGRDSSDTLTVQTRKYTLADVWSLKAKFATSEPVGGYAKGEEIIVQAEVRDLGTVLPEDVERGGWQAVLTLSVNEENETLTMEEKESAGEFETTIRKYREGAYKVTVSAVCGAWELEPQELGSFSINNTAPGIDTAENPPVIPVLWKNSLVDLNQDAKTTWEMSRYFTDDGITEDGEHELKFALKEDKEGVSISPSGSLTLEPEKMSTGLNRWTITVRDDEDAETDYPMSAECKDVKAVAESENAFELSIQAKTEGPYYKDTEIPMEICFTAGEEFSAYLGELDGNQRNEILSMISISASGMDGLSTGDVHVQEGSNGNYAADLILPNPRPSGSYTLKAEASVAGTNVTCSVSMALEIENRPPAKIDESSFPIRKTLLVPGPLFLNSEMEPEKYDVPLDQLISHEVLDELTIQIQGMNNGRFIWKQDGSWLYTDDDRALSGDSKIQWNTNEAFPGLQIQPTRHHVYQLTIRIQDDQEESVELPVELTAVYQNEQTLIYIAIGTAILLVAIILILTISSVTKPSYEGDSIIQVEAAGVRHDVHTAEWKKQGITLRDLLIFSGAPLLGDVSMKACDSVLFLPGRIKHGIGLVVKNNAPADSLTLQLHQARQNGKTVKVPDGDELEIIFEKGQTVRVVSHRTPQD